MRAAGTLLLATIATACSEDATQIVIAVDTDLTVPDEVTSIVLEIRSPEDELETRTFALAETGLPATVAVLRSKSPYRPLTVTARAMRAATTVVTTTVVTEFTPNRTRLLRVLLLRACQTASCPSGEACFDASGCRSNVVATAPFDGDPDRFAPTGDAGMPFDAGPPEDTGPLADTGPPPDTGPPIDGGCGGCLRGGTCMTGDAPSACGTGGVECVTCECGTDTCSAGSCVPERPVRSLATGLDWACFVVEDGSVYCMGDNSEGQLGRGALSPGDAIPGPATSSLGTGARSFGGGDAYVAFLRGSGDAVFWGGRPGPGTATPTATALGVSADQLGAGGYHVCALTAAGALTCSGSNTYGQLGDGTTSSTSSFRSVTGTWTDVSGGLHHTCGIRDGQMWCWGRNDQGQLGQGGTAGTPAFSSSPVRVGTATDWVDLDAGKDFTCGRRTDGSVVCWGDNGSRQLGVDTPDIFTTPAPPVDVAALTLTDVVALDAGRFHACVLRGAARTLWCWGGNQCGELGDGSMREASEPRPVPETAGHGRWAELGVGHTFTCATRENGSLWCWGRPGSHLVSDTNVCTPAEAISTPRRLCL